MRAAAIRLAAPNPLVTLQDAGRVGAMRYGVSQSGPMDWARFALATRLAGDAPAAFEVGLAGAAFIAEGGPVRVAVAGPGFVVRAGEGERLSPPVRLVLDEGHTLSLAPGRHGMWAYVAVTGLEAGPPVLGSVATNARTGLGARDLSRPIPAARATPAPPALFTDPCEDAGDVALLPGPQHHLFAPAVQARIVAAPYRLSDRLDRMGYRLEGAALSAETHDIVSDGVVEGAVQVPGNGQPIVLCADRAPTGGYPKIAVVARADRPRLAQRRPGESVQFRWTDEADANARRRALAQALRAPAPRVRTSFEPEFLAAHNLVDGVWAGAGPLPD